VPGASAATILWAGDVNDPMRSPQWRSRTEESFPIRSGCRRKDLGACWATVLLGSPVDIQSTFALEECFCGVRSSEIDLGAQAAFWASTLWLCGNTEQLAIVRLCVVAAAPVIPCHTVFILGAVPEVQVAICMVVSIWFTVPRAAKPPRRIILCHPRFLARVTGVHGIAGASSTSILWSGDVNDPIWRAKRLYGSDDSLPIRARPRRKKFGPIRATALVLGAANVPAIHTLYHRAWRIRTIHSGALALAGGRASLCWLCGYFLDAGAFICIDFALGQWRERSELCLLVVGSGRILLGNFALVHL